MANSGDEAKLVDEANLGEEEVPPEQFNIYYSYNMRGQELCDGIIASLNDSEQKLIDLNTRANQLINRSEVAKVYSIDLNGEYEQYIDDSVPRELTHMVRVLKTPRRRNESTRLYILTSFPPGFGRSLSREAHIEFDPRNVKYRVSYISGRNRRRQYLRMVNGNREYFSPNPTIYFINDSQRELNDKIFSERLDIWQKHQAIRKQLADILPIINRDSEATSLFEDDRDDYKRSLQCNTNINLLVQLMRVIREGLTVELARLDFVEDKMQDAFITNISKNEVLF